jgi:uncharacterized GH25 family protein
MCCSKILVGVSHRSHGALFTRLLAALIYGVPADAHDFWVQPAQYWLQPLIASSITLQVGHGPFRQRSPIPLSRILRFEAIGSDGVGNDLRGTLHRGGSTDDGAPTEDGEFRLKSPGAYVLVLQTDDRAQTHLPAIRFNDYLRVEGLTPALEQRARLHRTDAEGSERYSRCAKSIVQVGLPGAGSQEQVTKPVGLPLEIVPEASPYGIAPAAALPVRVIYAGHPLAGALVKLTKLESDAEPFEVRLTDRDGRASFTMPTSGTWLLNVIWTRALPRSEETDFETVFSSLSFGFPADRP